jgi:DegV family protein with EDD domain
MTHLITDTTACLAPEFGAQHNIPIIPQIIHFGLESFKEGEEIDNPTFMARLCTAKELPKTAAPPPELFVREFARLVPSGEPILCIHPSAEVSGTVRSVEVARQEFPDADIRLIDTRTIGSPLGVLVQRAAAWRDAGLSVDQIEAEVNALAARGRIYFMVDTLEYLQRGGRIGGASALLGSMLQIKPILHFPGGRVETYERERTTRRARARLIEIVCDQIDHTGQGFLTVMHAGIPEEGQRLAQELSAAIGQADVPVTNVPPAITIHGGPGMLAVAFFVPQA